MITVAAFQGRKVGVFGLGKAGDATIPSLIAGGAQVFAADDSEAGCARTAEKYGNAVTVLPIAQWPWKELGAVVLSPGVPLTHPKPHAVVEMAKKAACPIVGDIDMLYLSCPKARYVGITGTNGKSTTTTLIGHILKEAGLKVQVGGNLGTAALSLEKLGADGIYVLELSSYQLDLLHSAQFHVGAFLNVTPDHLDRHGDMDGYVKAKMKLFERQEKQDVAVIAVDDEYTTEAARQLEEGSTQVVRVSSQKALKEGVYVQARVLHDVGNDKQFNLGSIVTLTGAHNWQNAAVAYAVAQACGVRPEAIYAAMQSFGGLRHRLQQVVTVDGVRFINDSKATNADATSHALAPYEAIYWIAGGKAKAGGIESLEHLFSHVVHAFLIGDAQEDFAATLEGKVAYSRCGTLKVAVEMAAEMAFAQKKKGAVVLLSPACASFDQWKSFEERGDAFCEQAEALAAA